MSDASLDAPALPEPHTCPWWVQYMLISPLRRWMEPPEKLVGPYVEPGMTVLDAGCGFGFWSLPIARMVGPEGRVLCADIEPRAIERLLRRARRAGLEERIEARACEHQDLGFADHVGTVDLITVIHTLHEFVDLPGFLAQARDLLSPEGRLLVLEPRGHVTPEQFEAEREACRAAGFQELEPPRTSGRQLGMVLVTGSPT
jgi:ubiquinone/menaquinone biosynthesis C-methylase UbiE